MSHLLTTNLDTSILIALMLLAIARIYLEILGFNWSMLPMTKSLGNKVGTERMYRFHKMGLYFSIGFVVLFAPELLFYR
jgi:hypothetical protein